MGPDPTGLVSKREIRTQTRRGRPCEGTGDTATYKPRTEASGEADPADTLILAFQSPEL